MVRIPVATVDGAPPTWVTRVPRISGAFASAVASIVLIGWATGSVPLKTFGGADVFPLLAAVIVLAVAVFLILTHEPLGPRPRSATVLVTLITVAGVFSLVQALTDLVPDADETLFPSLQNSIAVLLFGLCQIGPGQRWAARFRAVALTLFVVIGIGFSLAEIYGAHDLTDLEGGAPPTRPGTIAFAAISVGLCAVRSRHQPISWLWPDNLTGTFARRLLPTAVFLPISLGVVSYIGYAADWYSLPFALTVLTVAVTTAMIGVVTITADVLSRAEKRIVRATTRFQALLDAAPYATVLVDPAGIVRYANPPVEILLGYRPAELVGQAIEVIIPARFRSGHALLRATFVAPAMGGDGGHPADLWALHRAGHEVPIEISLSSVSFAEGPNTVVALRDVSEKRSSEVALREAHERYRILSEHDELTGLPNRRKFEAELDRHFEVIRAADGGLLYIDLDHFKEVNDTLGHRAGDQLLTRVAQAMLARMPDGGVLARQGGDEFLVLLRRGGAEEAREVADQLRDAVREASAAFEDGVFEVSASIGIVAVDQIPPNERPSTAALICADIALYSAKSGGRDQVAVFHEV